MFLFSIEVPQQAQETNHYSDNKKRKLILYITIPIVSIIIISIITYFFLSHRNNNFQWDQREELSLIIHEIISQYKIIGWKMDKIERCNSEDLINVDNPIRDSKNNELYKSKNISQYIKEEDIIDKAVKDAIEKKPKNETKEYKSYIEELVLSINYNLNQMKKKESLNIKEMVEVIKEFSTFIHKAWLEMKKHYDIIETVKKQYKEKGVSKCISDIICLEYNCGNTIIPLAFRIQDLHEPNDQEKELIIRNYNTIGEYDNVVNFNILLLVENYFKELLLEYSAVEETLIHESIKKLKIVQLILKVKPKNISVLD